MSNHSLICPFLNEDPLFAYGVEFGMLYARMRSEDERVIEDYFCRANQDQILLCASRLGWRIAFIEPWDRYWFRLSMTRD